METLEPNLAFPPLGCKASMVQTIKHPKTPNSLLIGAARARISLLPFLAITHRFHKKMRPRLVPREKCTWLIPLLINRLLQDRIPLWPKMTTAIKGSNIRTKSLIIPKLKEAHQVDASMEQVEKTVVLFLESLLNSDRNTMT